MGRLVYQKGFDLLIVLICLIDQQIHDGEPGGDIHDRPAGHLRLRGVRNQLLRAAVHQLCQ